MVTLYTAGKKYECAEVKQIQCKMLITGTGQEYLLMYDFANQQYLYTVQRGEGERPEFTFIDKVIQIEDELQRKRIG